MNRGLINSQASINADFWIQVAPCATEEDCYIWTGPVNTKGYGVISFQGRHWVAHRLAWYLAGREVPPGMELDHLCENKACVNVSHLDPVTRAENMRRANAGPTRCKEGHIMVCPMCE